jgi:hypothetical protein
MSKRIGTSFADLLSAMQQVAAGLSTSQEDPKQASYAKDLKALHESLRSLDERQEKAKAELHTTSEQLSEKEKEARLLLSKAISYLESEYGKSSTELERYGIAKRQLTGRKALKKDPVKT